jgi:hypothetical protein
MIFPSWRQNRRQIINYCIAVDTCALVCILISAQESNSVSVTWIPSTVSIIRNNILMNYIVIGVCRRNFLIVHSKLSCNICHIIFIETFEAPYLSNLLNFSLLSKIERRLIRSPVYLSVCVTHAITFEPIGRFWWHLVWRWYHLKGPLCHNFNSIPSIVLKWLGFKLLRWMQYL